MKRTLLSFVLVLGMIASTLAFARMPTALTVNDTGFDYGNTATGEAYIQLAFVDGQLEIVLDDEQLATALPTVDVSVPDPENDVTVWLASIDEIGLTDFGLNYKEVSFIHPDVSLSDTTEAYTAAMNRIGFDLVSEQGSRNVRAFIFEHGDSRVGIKFIRDGNNVVAELSGI